MFDKGDSVKCIDSFGTHYATKKIKRVNRKSVITNDDRKWDKKSGGFISGRWTYPYPYIKKV